MIVGAIGKRGSGFLGLVMMMALVAVAQCAAPAVAQPVNFDVLKGTWVRPDGGYTIAIKAIDASGQIEAMYFNPKQLPFAKAFASKEGAIVRVSFECAPEATMARRTNSPTIPRPIASMGSTIRRS